jgi:hypothetical protein
MEKVVGKIIRVKGLSYRIDKEGRIIEESYNWFKDKTTLVVLVIIILGGLYYLQMSQSVTNASNFDEYCTIYSNIRADYIRDNPGKEVNIGNVLEYYERNKLNFETKFDLNPDG